LVGVPGHGDETKVLEQIVQLFRLRGSKFDDFEFLDAKGVRTRIGHCGSPETGFDADARAFAVADRINISYI
ncbi:MAG TPA: hypothetical protein VKO85_05190, partial [Wenzhouxiangellaceae bacterium]|nr:hypothetical protein [Wenzhouxiangellaceae bacterium]